MQSGSLSDSGQGKCKEGLEFGEAFIRKPEKEQGRDKPRILYPFTHSAEIFQTGNFRELQ